MKILLLREAGGFGDVIRCCGVARSIKAVKPDAQVTFATLLGYEPIITLCPDIDHSIGLGKMRRRDRDEFPDPAKFRYIADVGADFNVDLFCPGWVYERDHAPDIKRDRYASWTEAAARTTGLSLVPMVPTFDVPEEYVEKGREWLMQHGIQIGAGPIVGVAPFGTHSLRRLTSHQAAAVCRLLKNEGCQIVIISTWKHYWDSLAKEVGGANTIDVSTECLFGMALLIDHFVTVDTGILHLASSLGRPCTVVFSTTHSRDLCMRYPLATGIDPGPEERKGLGCQSPCYHISFTEQKSLCSQAEACHAMSRISPELIASTAMAQMAVRR